MRVIVLFLLALCAASPAGASKPHPPAPVGNPGMWLQPDDYPVSALRGHIEGTVQFTLTIDATGHPTGCKVTASSGYSDLDDVACAKILERANFTPATDSKGRPVAGTWGNSVRWQIPDDSSDGTMRIPAPGFAITTFIVETDGTISDCRVEKAEGGFAGTNPQDCPSGQKIAPILDANGKAVRKRVRMELRIEQEDVAP